MLYDCVTEYLPCMLNVVFFKRLILAPAKWRRDINRFFDLPRIGSHNPPPYPTVPGYEFPFICGLEFCLKVRPYSHNTGRKYDKAPSVDYDIKQV